MVPTGRWSGEPGAVGAIDDFLALPGLALLPVPGDLITRWADLIRQSSATKKRAFDTQLVATMLAASGKKIYTFNTADFQVFGSAGIQTLTP